MVQSGLAQKYSLRQHLRIQEGMTLLTWVLPKYYKCNGQWGADLSRVGKQKETDKTSLSLWLEMEPRDYSLSSADWPTRSHVGNLEDIWRQPVAFQTRRSGGARARFSNALPLTRPSILSGIGWCSPQGLLPTWGNGGVSIHCSNSLILNSNHYATD